MKKIIVSALLAAAFLTVSLPAGAYWEYSEHMLDFSCFLNYADEVCYTAYTRGSEELYLFNMETDEQVSCYNRITHENAYAAQNSDINKLRQEHGLDPIPTSTPRPTPTIAPEKESSGIHAVKQDESGLSTFFSADGEQLTPYIYDVVWDFGYEHQFEYYTYSPHGFPTLHLERLISPVEHAAIWENGAIKYIDTDFREIDIYDRHQPFYNKREDLGDNFLQLSVTAPDTKENTVTGVVDKNTGKAVIMRGDYGFDRAADADEVAIIFVTDTGKYGAVDDEGNLLLEPVYEHLGFFSSEMFLAGITDENGKMKYGLIGRDGNVYVDITNDNISGFADGAIQIRDGEETVCVNFAGNEVIPHEKLYARDDGLGVSSKNSVDWERNVVSVCNTFNNETLIYKFKNEYACIWLDGGYVDFEGLNAVHEDGVTYAPGAALAKALGASVEVKLNGLIIERGDMQLSFYENSPYMTLGNTNIALDAAPKQENGTLMIPAEALASALGYKAEYMPVSHILKLESGQ